MLEYFLDPHPDELLYSVWARISDQARYANRGDVALELFGNRSFSALVDWSCSLGYLVSQLPEGHCYTADLLIDSHTLFPFYAPFLPPERAQLLRDQMTYGNGVAFAARLGMLTSGIPPHKWLRYCQSVSRAIAASSGRPTGIAFIKSREWRSARNTLSSSRRVRLQEDIKSRLFSAPNASFSQRAPVRRPVRCWTAF